MTSVAEEIDGYRKELREIVGRGADDDILKGLLELARKVGACTRTPRSSGSKKEQIDDLVQSINQALQTASMIDACRTAAKNYEIALDAKESARQSKWIAVGAMLAAAAAAIAAWVWH